MNTYQNYQDLLNESNIQADDIICDTLTTTGNVSVGGSLSIAGLTANSILGMNSTNTLSSLVMGNGQLLIGKNGQLPSVTALAAGSSGNLNITNGSGSVTLDVSLTPSFTTVTTSSTVTSQNGTSTFPNLSTNGIFLNSKTVNIGTTTELVRGANSVGNNLLFTFPSVTSSAWQFLQAQDAFQTCQWATLQAGVSANLTVTNAAGSATIDTIDSPTFTGISLSGLNTNQPVVTNIFRQLVSSGINLANPTSVSGILPILNGGTNSGTALTNGKLMVSSGGTIIEGTSSSSPSFTGLTLSGVASGLVSSAAGVLQTTGFAAASNGISGSFSGSTVTVTASQDLAITGSPQWVALNLSKTSNQLLLGATNIVTLNAASPTGSRAYTIPDTLTSTANFCMSEGATVVHGAWTMTSPSITTPTLTYSVADTMCYFNASKVLTQTAAATNGQLLIGNTGNIPSLATLTQSTNMNITNGGGSISLATSLVPVFTTVAANQVTGQLILSGPTRTATVSAVSPATSSRTYTLQDAGADANICMDHSNFTIAGTWNFTNLTATSATNQLILSGPTRTATISALQPATSSRVYTFPDAGADSSIVMDHGAYSMNGIITFAATPVVSTMTATRLLANDASHNLAAVTISNANGCNTSFAGTTLTCTMTQGLTTAGTPTFASLTLSATNNQMIFGSVFTTQLSVRAPAASQTITVPDAGNSSNMVLDQGAYTISGAWTFGQSILLPTTGGTATGFGYYEESTFTSNASGPWVATSWTMVVTRIGRQVTIVFPSYQANSTVGAGITLATALPTKWQPNGTSDLFLAATVWNSSVLFTNGVIKIIAAGNANAGKITIATQNQGTFTNGVSTGIFPFSVTYFV